MGRGSRRLAVAPTQRQQQRGQATVELAFLLPVLAVLLLGLIQIGIVVRAKVLTVHAAREAARAAAVDDDAHSAAATSGLVPGRYTVGVQTAGEQVIATITYTDPTDVPLIGVLLPDVTLTSTAIMRHEDWPSP